MSYVVTTDPARINVDEIHTMLAQTYWSANIRRDIVETALRNSIVALAIDASTGSIVGVARVVTDHATFAYLCDVFVLPAHRGQGLSRRLLEELEQWPTLGTVRRWCLVTRDAHGLYEKFGYSLVKPGAWMERKPPSCVWQA